MAPLSRPLALWKSPAAIYLGAAILSRAASLFLIPLYTRRLTVEEYGRYALFLTLLAFLSTFLSAGLLSAIPTEYFSDKDHAVGKRRASEVSRWIALLVLGGATLSLVGAGLFAANDPTSLFGRKTLSLAIVGSAGMAIGTVPWTLLRSEQRPYPAAAFQLLEFTTMTGAGLLLVLVLRRGYEGAIEAAALAPAVNALAALIYIWRLPKSGLHLKRLRAALRFALPFLPHFVAGWLLGASDLWILRRAGFALELGSYSLAAQVVAPVSMVITAWNLHMAAEMGACFRADGIPGMRSRLPGVRLTYIASAVVPGVALLLGLPLVASVVGERFESAIVFVPFLVLAILPNALYFADFQILYYSGRSWRIAGATVAAAVLTVVVGLLVIPRYGAYGAVAARVTGALVRSLVVVHSAGKTTDVTRS